MRRAWLLGRDCLKVAVNLTVEINDLHYNVWNHGVHRDTVDAIPALIGEDVVAGE